MKVVIQNWVFLFFSFTGRFNIYDLILDKNYFDKREMDDVKGDPKGQGASQKPMPSKEDMTLVKVRVELHKPHFFHMCSRLEREWFTCKKVQKVCLAYGTFVTSNLFPSSTK